MLSDASSFRPQQGKECKQPASTQEKIVFPFMVSEVFSDSTRTSIQSRLKTDGPSDWKIGRQVLVQQVRRGICPCSEVSHQSNNTRKETNHTSRRITKEKSIRISKEKEQSEQKQQERTQRPKQERSLKLLPSRRPLSLNL